MRLNVSTYDPLSRTSMLTSITVIARLQQIHIVTNEIDAKAKELSADYDASLDQFSPLFYRLTSEFEPELDRYRLDEVVVGAITPLVCGSARVVILRENNRILLTGAKNSSSVATDGRSSGVHIHFPELEARLEIQCRG